MRTVFMGNPEFAIPSIQAIKNSRYNLIAVVSNPPKPFGRKRLRQLTPVGQYARDHNILFIEASNVKSEDLKIKLSKLKPDLFVVVAYKILPPSLINIPKYGSINLHASLLPKYRGAAPIQWSLMNGDKETGITVFQIKPSVDTGDIVAQKKIKISDEDNMQTLGKRLSISGSNLVLDAMKKIEQGDMGIPQNTNHATKAPKIEKEMTIINWSWTARKIHNWIRGLTPKPGMSTYINGKRIRVYKTKVLNNDYGNPGAIVNVNKDNIIVSTSKGSLSLLEIQLEGKKKLAVNDFLKGYDIKLGTVLGR